MSKVLVEADVEESLVEHVESVYGVTVIVKDAVVVAEIVITT